WCTLTRKRVVHFNPQNDTISPLSLSFGCMKIEVCGVPASVRHPDAILMLRLALLRFSLHLFDQYFRDSVLNDHKGSVQRPRWTPSLLSRPNR
ncbi:MAG: hypothetical protein ACPGN3_18075, partial [Opitutales bacterium]